MYTYKVVLHPNNKQKTKLKMIMNKCIEAQNIVYDYLSEFLEKSKKEKNKQGNYLSFPKCTEVRRWFTIQKQIKDQEVLEKRASMTKREQRENHLDFLFCECTNDALKQTVKDTYASFIRFLKGISKYPVRKKYIEDKKSFYMDPFKIKFTNRKVRLEKISNSTKRDRCVLNWINLAERNRIPTSCKYYNPRVSYDGYSFYLTVSVSDDNAPIKYIQKKENIKKEDEVIGVDVNIENIVTSNKDGSITNSFSSINKTNKVKRIEKRFVRTQKALSRKYESHKITKKALKESKNYIKTKYKLHKLRFKLQSIRDGYLYYFLNEMLFIDTNTVPKKIVIEDLDVKEMMSTKLEDIKHKNKYLRPLLQKTSFGKILEKIKEKCLFYGIELTQADRYYASSKMCSLCKNKKSDLRLSDRIYKCDKCGIVIDRDLNAAINLANY